MYHSLDTSLNHEEDDQEIDEPQSDINLIRRSTRTRRPTDRLCLYVDDEEHKLEDHGEPTNYKAVQLDPESDKWFNVMNVEMQSMKDNEVWELVDLPPNGKTVGHKWLFKKKIDMDGAVHAYKARLVVKGFTQTPRIDYEETFSPVADIRAIRIFIAIATFYDYKIWQMDVKTAFLNRYLNEERMQNIPYASVVRSIMYAMRCTRHDVAFAQNITSRFQQNPGDLHWTTVKNILKYLRNTKDMFLVYGVLNGGAFDWKSTKQSIFAASFTDAEYIATNILKYLRNTKDMFLVYGASFTDAEYIATFDASKEAVWIRKFIYGLGVVPTIEEPISMYCDNTKAIAIAKDHGVTKGARHFRSKVHYLRETTEMGDVRIEKVDTYDNLADPFTMALAFHVANYQYIYSLQPATPTPK
nr:hypothetical protein [Tanacetum cinerariifolium]